ncbi:xanthine dehydrogenase family protein molybdopterin-binding subunit [Propylenella binzhouense]|uniref:Xanthine dehydrogenase family protein molybdopterin-binding subunit n=1 Tax=Propylenella binzhouense TaxID=2555902 RepID=A0A964T335_9HYPH|nr:xanthine dehydrogenase family protein molybdopterin-binding subunit [Propylenella binzhouense]MYZ47548.1 xanthine dehydrogenase family protein molybdopterin-binding subunit [Propylenella binzhouense]
MAERGIIGKSLPRLEDPPLVTGRGRFAADINFPHQLHMRIVRSAMAHARIVSIDAEAARALPGVVAVWTAADIPDASPVDFREGPNEKLAPYRQHVLAREAVRYVGDPVAAVFAESAYVAEDAADLVAVEYEELPVVLAADAPPGEFSPGRSTEATLVRQDYGDIDAAFAAAHLVVELDLSVGRHTGVPMETRGAIGRYDAARDVLELHGAAKVPHKNRDSLGRMLGRDVTGIHLYESHVGGGFGVRGELYPEDILVLMAAMRLGRPVKWIEDRREHLMATNHSRQQRHRIRAAVDAEGRLLAIDNEFFHDQGAYIRTHGTRVADSTCGLLPGPYRLPVYRARGHFRLTNKTPAATYRSPSRYETNFVRERVMDEIGRRLGLSPVDVRRRNFLAKEEMPFARPLAALGENVVYDSGDYALLLDKALAAFRWDEVQADMARRRAAGEMVGAALAVFVEKSGLGPTDGARVIVDTTGAVEVVTGGASVGQGFETVVAQVCAETLGVDYDRIRVTHGRTDRIEYGLGAHASRATVMTANATAAAAARVRAKALDVAAEMMQAPIEALDIVAGRVVRTDIESGPSVALGEIARNLAPSAKLRNGREPGLSSDGWFDTEHQTYPYGVQMAVVKVDPETGGVAVERMLVGYDIGRAINPMLVHGQIAGGFAQGLGGALYEEFRYSETGDPLSVTFADYLIPTASEVPEVEILLTEDAPSPCNPLGIKGAGESGIAAVGAVIASAVDEAIGIPGAITELPITPQRLKRILAGIRRPLAAE